MSDLSVSYAILHRWVNQDKIDQGEIIAVALAESVNYVNREGVLVNRKTRLRFLEGLMACWGSQTCHPKRLHAEH